MAVGCALGMPFGSEEEGARCARDGVELKEGEFGEFFAPLGDAVAVEGSRAGDTRFNSAAIPLFLGGGGGAYLLPRHAGCEKRDK